MHKDLIEKLPDWNEILSKLSDKLYNDFFKKESSSRFTFEYSSDLETFKENARYALAEMLSEQKVKTLDAYKGAFTRELEGRLMKESAFFQKQFDDAVSFISTIIADYFKQETDKLEFQIRSLFREQLTLLKEQHQEKIDRILRSEKSHQEKQIAAMRAQAEAEYKESEEEIRKSFADQLRCGRAEIEKDSRLARERELLDFNYFQKQSVEKLRGELEISNQEALSQYRSELNQKLRNEVNSWLDARLDNLKKENEIILDAERVRIESEMINKLREIQSTWNSKLQHWSHSIRLQSRPHKAKELNQNMEKEAAAMLRELTGTIQQFRQQANIHIDQISSTVKNTDPSGFKF